MTHTHRFDDVSGWCSCGYRDDGRLLKNSIIVRPGNQTPDEPQEQDT